MEAKGQKDFEDVLVVKVSLELHCLYRHQISDDPLERWASPVKTGPLVVQEIPVNQDCLDVQDLKAAQALSASLAGLDLGVFQDLSVILDHPVSLELQENKVFLVKQAPLVLLAVLVVVLVSVSLW